MAAPSPRALESLAKESDLRIAADEARESSSCGGLQARADGARTDKFEDLNRTWQALHADRAEGRHLHEAFGEDERFVGQQDGARTRHLLHSGGQVRGLPHGRVVHAKVRADGAYDDLARVQANPDLDGDTLSSPHLFGVQPDRLLQPERCVAGADGVIFLSERRAKERHDPVAHHLIDGALVAVNRLHHSLEDRIKNLARLLRIAVGE